MRSRSRCVEEHHGRSGPVRRPASAEPARAGQPPRGLLGPLQLFGNQPTLRPFGFATAQRSLDVQQLLVVDGQPERDRHHASQVRAVVVPPGHEGARNDAGRVDHVDTGQEEGGERVPVRGPRDARRPPVSGSQPRRLLHRKRWLESGDRVLVVRQQEVPVAGAVLAVGSDPLVVRRDLDDLPSGVAAFRREPPLACPLTDRGRPEEQRTVDPGPVKSAGPLKQECILQGLRAERLTETDQSRPLVLGDRL